MIGARIRPDSHLDEKTESGKAEVNQNSWKEADKRNVLPTTTASSD